MQKTAKNSTFKNAKKKKTKKNFAKKISHPYSTHEKLPKNAIKKNWT